MERVIGGQAVPDGVLILNGHQYAVAVQGTKKIELSEGQLPILKAGVMKIPFIRGIIALLSTLYIGFTAMGFSTQASSDEEFGTGVLAISLLFSLLLALTLFKLLPFVLADIVISRSHPVLFNLLDGILRITIFLAYLYLISKMNDVKKMFEYHGAEHKAINAYESTNKISLSTTKKASRFHTRCSTSFVVLVLIVAVIIFSLVPLNMSTWKVILIRLILVLPIASISYEIIKLSSKNENNILFKPIIFSGKLVQRMTTREPSSKQIKVALTALRAALKSSQ